MVIDNAFIREIHPELQETKHLWSPIESTEKQCTLWRLQTTGMWHSIVFYIGTNVLGEPTIFIFNPDHGDDRFLQNISTHTLIDMTPCPKDSSLCIHRYVNFKHHNLHYV